MTPSERARSTPIATHVAAGWRLRSAFESHEDGDALVEAGTPTAVASWWYTATRNGQAGS